MINNHQKQGIALVMVLGFLALLIISSVSFSVLMRTERLATRSYVDVVKARNLLHLALARAMEDIDLQMTSGGLLVAPPSSVLTSTDTATGSSTNLFAGELQAERYIPPFLFPGANIAVPWIAIQDPVNNQIVGRYTFVAVDSSGFLDANVISGSGLSFGTDPRDIRYDIVPELPADFLTIRANPWMRFDTLPELAMAASGVPNSTFIYSRFPNMYLDASDEAQPRVSIGGDPADWDQASIVDALQGLVPNPTDFFGVMQDFASSSYVPLDGNYNRINARRVPMINEVVVSNTFERIDDGLGAGATIRHRAHVLVETWYPFPADPGGNFSVNIEIPSMVTGFLPGPPPIMDQPDLEPGDQSITMAPFSYSVVTNVFVRDVALPDWPLPSATPQVGVQLSIANIQVLAGAGAVADQAGPFQPAHFAFVGAFPDLAPGETYEMPLIRHRGVLDPRINWNPSDNSQWDVEEPPTPGEPNTLLVNAINAGAVDEREVGQLYSNASAGQGFRSLGDLSFLLYDPSKPWTTIRLLDNIDFSDPDNPRELFDRLTLHPTNRPATFGLVNPNTWQPDVLGLVLQGAWVESYPNEQEGNPDAGLSGADALQLAENLLDLQSTLPNNVFRSRSDLLGLALPTGADNKFLAESPLRNTIDLFDTQQNLFTIIIAAQATTDDADNPVVLADQRAVAVVWRDPYPDADGRHLAFVRYLRFLSD